jgi:hypothetical protein
MHNTLIGPTGAAIANPMIFVEPFVRVRESSETA